MPSGRFFERRGHCDGKPYAASRTGGKAGGPRGDGGLSFVPRLPLKKGFGIFFAGGGAIGAVLLAERSFHLGTVTGL